MAKRIEGKTREQLTKLITSYIKESYKNMGKATNRNLHIELHNWRSGFGRNSKWSFSEVEVGDNSYKFTDKEITDEQLIYILNNAIAASKVRAKVYSKTYGYGYWIPKETRFERVEIYAKPCKEFNSLVKTIEKYANFTLHETDIFDVRVCGKRSSWSDSGRFDYLCYNANTCNAIIDTIKKNRTTKDKVSVKVEEYFSHGDEIDYKYAQYNESEWYGCRGNKLIVNITTPKGKTKVDKSFYMRDRGW